MKKPAEIAGAVGLTALALYFTALISSPRSGDKPSLGRLLEQILEARLEEGTKGSVAERTRRTYPERVGKPSLPLSNKGWSAERLAEARDYFDSMGADDFSSCTTDAFSSIGVRSGSSTWLPYGRAC